MGEDQDTSQLRVVLRLVRTVITRMSERDPSFEAHVQNLLVRLGALRMVHEQMCRQRNEPDLCV